MARREYQGASVPTTITSAITNSATSLTLTASTNWPTGSFSAVIDPGLAGEEKILCTSRSGATVTITTRGYDGTTAASHNAGAIIYPVPTAIDFDEANAHTVASTGVHGITGAVVGTTDTQTLSAKTLTSPIISTITNTGTITLPTASDTLVGRATTDTLSNKSIQAPNEVVQIVGTGFAGYTFDVLTGGVVYITAASTANGTLNFRGNSGTTLNTVLATGQSVSCVLAITNTSSAFFPNAFQVDGSAVTPKWAGGTAPSAGNANAIDGYSFTIIKTASATFTVLAGVTKFA